LDRLLEELHARPLNELRVFVDGGDSRIELRGNVVISREAFDAALVARAVAAGAVFVPGALAQSSHIEDECRCVGVRANNETLELRARVVLVATGLNSPLLDVETEMASIASEDSRMGVGAVLNDAPEFFTAGTVFMACGGNGYVGLVRLEDGRLNIAAALDSDYLRAFETPAEAVEDVLRKAGMPQMKRLHDARWHGTPRLTRKRTRVSAPRMLAIGDAAGYVEPFTGEGMAWAMRSGMIAAKLICDECGNIEAAWEAAYRDEIKARQSSCAMIARLLRRPRLAQAGVALLEKSPMLARMLLRRMEPAGH